MIMQPLYDPHAPKKATNLSVNSDLLNKIRKQRVNLSATLERALADALRENRRDQWLADNRSAIDAYNKDVEEHGVFSDGLRNF